jgi:transcriptional regulator with XRE-family HTH domain
MNANISMLPGINACVKNRRGMAKHDAPPGAEENLPPRKRSAKFDSARLRFGVRLRQIRDDLGLSQKAFAELVHELQPSIVRWEKGETIPGFDKVESFAKALGIGVSAFSTAEPYIPESARPAAAADEALSEDIAQLFLSRLRDPHDVLHAELRAHLAPKEKGRNC